jgi:ABC-2 type transport system ATP-binding protein
MRRITIRRRSGRRWTAAGTSGNWPAHFASSKLHRSPPEAELNPVTPIVSVSGVSKTYASGLQALRRIDLDIYRGEIFALLGPNGAGKTTLISIICGIVNATAGTVLVDGHHIVRDYRGARSCIGLVPQELTTDAFETVWATVSLSRGLFGRRRDPALLERVLRDLSLWDKKDSRIFSLSGGMKRRLLIAKALAHEPKVLFLDEPTAGVDVELRRDMWRMVRGLRDSGVTVILTTHYLQEAEELADRVGMMRKGELFLVEEKDALMQRFGSRRITLALARRLDTIPPALASFGLTLSGDGRELTYTYGGAHGQSGVQSLFRAVEAVGLAYSDVQAEQSSLEDIFVKIVRGQA